MARAIVRSGRRPFTALAVLLAGIIGLSGAAFLIYGPSPQSKASIQPIATLRAEPQPAVKPEEPLVLASPGRIEARSDVVEVGAALDGIIQSLSVREGQWVAAGDTIAELDCRDLQSMLPVAQAEAESLRQVRARLLIGSRHEEREAAAQRTAAAKATADQTARQAERYRQLAASDTISKSSFDAALRDANVAKADYEQALHNEELVNAKPLSEDVAKADADVQASEKRIMLAEEKLAKCVVKAPTSGTVVRILLHPGESFALFAPRPILTLADLSGRRVRAEVDERDVAKVHLGQAVIVFSDAYNGKRFTGKVTSIASMMGRKTVLTGDPIDKADRDILEVVAQLEHSAIALPVGLRATVQFRP